MLNLEVRDPAGEDQRQYRDSEWWDWVIGRTMEVRDWHDMRTPVSY